MKLVENSRNLICFCLIESFIILSPKPFYRLRITILISNNNFRHSYGLQIKLLNGMVQS